MGGSGGPLPVKLLYFNVKKENNTGQISWATAMEKDNDYFDIEKSMDGKNFKTIGKINGAGNSQQILKYTFTDSNLSPGLNYYRLKQTDYDGKFTYSPVDVISFSPEQTEKIDYKIYPVPASDIIYIDMNSHTDLQTHFKIVNVLGTIVLQKNVFLQIGNNHLEIDLNEMSGGVYFILFDGLRESKSTRFFVNK